MTPSNISRPTETVLQPSSVKIPRPHDNLQQIGVWQNPAGGLDISVVAPRATAVDFCIVTGEGTGRREQRWSLRGPKWGIWHGHLEGVGEGTVYGFRAFGPWDPDNGLYYNPNKFLLDPYGRGVTGIPELSPALHAHHVDHEMYPTTYPLAESNLNSALFAPASVVVGNGYGLTPGPRIPTDKVVLYEVHVKGFTQKMPGVPKHLRGTYAGLAHPETIKYLKSLGVTSLELLPVHAKMDEPFLTERGLTNYWGYSTMSFFAPEPSYATQAAQAGGAQAVVNEFRGMVSILHDAGLEVILDVVYNHTCEGGDTGPTVCWRGLDSLLYYRRMPDRPRYMLNDTGCGNTLNFSEPRVVQMTLDSLRYWVQSMGVDGFRFDLATTLGRLDTGYTDYHPFLVAAGEDPALWNIKLVAEPWDMGMGGWQTGNFPIPFGEWNDRYRDSVRKFWLTDFQQQSAGRPVSGPNDLATRLTGSADLFDWRQGARRRPMASVNFLTAHDGFTLADLTSYDHKHNMANLENNQDGNNNNHSWNHGIEGTSSTFRGDPEFTDFSGVAEELTYARERSRRNLLTTMLISAGTPMITAGDEFARTQYGNNNAYCQDSPISWVDWNWDDSQRDLFTWVQYMIALRRHHTVLRPRHFASGRTIGEDTMPDITWFTRKGEEITPEAWSNPENRVFQMRRSGQPWDDVDMLLVVNGTLNVAKVTLPVAHGGPWVLVADTSWPTSEQGGISHAEAALDQGERVKPGGKYVMEPQSLAIYFSAERG